MKSIYAAPLRVYLCLIALAIFGVYSGLKLPISLFPNSSQPQFWVPVPYGQMSAKDFLRTYGTPLEDQIRAINVDHAHVEKLSVNYEANQAMFEILFSWDSKNTEAERELKSIVNNFAAQFSDEMRRGIRFWSNNENGGFVAIAFYSEQRSLDEVFEAIDPIITPRISKIPDATDSGLYNPSRKEIRIVLKPEQMALLGFCHAILNLHSTNR